MLTSFLGRSSAHPRPRPYDRPARTRGRRCRRPRHALEGLLEPLHVSDTDADSTQVRGLRTSRRWHGPAPMRRLQREERRRPDPTQRRRQWRARGAPARHRQPAPRRRRGWAPSRRRARIRRRQPRAVVGGVFFAAAPWTSALTTEIHG